MTTFRRVTGRRSPIAILVTALVLTACSAPSPTRSEGEGLHAEQSDPEFKLLMSTPKATWSEEEAIDVGASLAYLGDLANATLFASGSGVLGFSVEESNGDKEMGAAWHDDCKRYTIGPHQPISTAYRKSGGWGQEDPNAAFYEAFFADPLFHLPRGEWKITALVMFSFGNGCGQGRRVDLSASITITVA